MPWRTQHEHVVDKLDNSTRSVVGTSGSLPRSRGRHVLLFSQPHGRGCARRYVCGLLLHLHAMRAVGVMIAKASTSKVHTLARARAHTHTHTHPEHIRARTRVHAPRKASCTMCLPLQHFQHCARSILFAGTNIIYHIGCGTPNRGQPACTHCAGGVTTGSCPGSGEEVACNDNTTNILFSKSLDGPWDQFNAPFIKSPVMGTPYQVLKKSSRAYWIH